MKPTPASLGLVALLFVSTLATPSPGRLATTSTMIAVTTIEDELNNDGFCSLREAIVAANFDQPSGAMPGECPAGSGDDTISLPAGTYTLTLSSEGLPDTALSGDLDITSSLTIAGTGAQNSIIDGGNLSRVMEISGVVVVTIAGVTLQNGRGPDVEPGVVPGGAGLYVHEGSIVALDASQIARNIAVFGAGLVNEGLVTLTDSHVTGNRAVLATGGIDNSGTMTLTRSLIEGNDAFGVSYSGKYPSVGGIRNSGNLVIINSTIAENSTDIHGGGIANYGTLTMTNSTLMSNTAESGGGLWNSGIAMVVASTIDDNWDSGVYNAGKLTLINDTVSQNYSNNSYSGTGSEPAGGRGGGIYNDSGILFLNNVTLANNSVGFYYRKMQDPIIGQGGGIFVSGGAVTITNSLLGQNLALGGWHDYSDDCWGTLTFAEYDLIQALRCPISTTGPGNLVGRSPLVDRLGDNGGFTFTQALSPGSPAIDAGNPAIPGSSEYDCAASDQRGIARPANEACDIGAYEFAGHVFRFFLPIALRGL